MGRWLYLLLRRRTSSREFLPQVDGLRWYAIAAVLLHHCAGYVIQSPASPQARSFQRLDIEAFTRYGALGGGRVRDAAARAQHAAARAARMLGVVGCVEA
jgi:hypothetical protein